MKKSTRIGAILALTIVAPSFASWWWDWWHIGSQPIIVKRETIGGRDY